MSYLALARKWRPRTFSELVGQEHINKALVNALKQQRLHHAYLFTGTRGVGKTSVARILAKALNCESGITPEPCLQCDTCIAIEQGRFIDLIEIDGASKTRVEDTRDLLDNVQYAPTNGRFKIYLIDEVHMLSQHSFNALLKTLEEPPAHVKFILATTDPQKLPVTVLSRCLQFNLKHLSIEVIRQQLQNILNKEQFDYEIQAIEILAQAARGSMRDALSILDQAITSCENKLLASEVKTLLGYTQKDYALLLLKALAEQDAATLLTLSQQISIEGGHFQYVLDELLNHLHQMTICQHLPNNNPLISTQSEIRTLAKKFAQEDVQLFYQIAIKGQEDIHLAPTLAIGFNMTLLRMLTFRPAPLAITPALDFERTDSKASEINPSKELGHKDEFNSIIDSAPKIVPHEEVLASHTSENEQNSIAESRDWSAIIPQLKLSGIALNAVENAAFLSKEGKEISLAVDKGHLSLFTPTTTTRIEAALSNYYNSPIKIVLSSQGGSIASPAQEKVKSTLQKQEKAVTALQSDPMFQKVQQEFSAELVKNSIVLLKDEL
ncbi:DNA polymerase III subunit gamma/tau [Legionella waltersii]|uniref:DNA polymerase III subunit gamma/tau n=1 Tax=Legionella waltersii TaxID=66969 RepID=A0A0W1AJY5_9GAMM|nr:DNA polymerase III subunit gamma/tau [Legionella waltersii]KTD81590.1 DNA polymerase III subunit gamma/tau [Legionella waltersii]SNV13155.1 DNA polymerase III subunit gamma/tau [Legionella waltersii]